MFAADSQATGGRSACRALQHQEWQDQIAARGVGKSLAGDEILQACGTRFGQQIGAHRMGDHDQSRALRTKPCYPIDQALPELPMGHRHISWRRDEGVM
jgi:hypothetical protein